MPTPARTRLPEPTIEAFVRSHPGWRLEQGELRKTYDFKTFTDSMRFVNVIAELAEKENHHPDIDIRYSKVTIALSTHSAGGITEKDIALARAIDISPEPENPAEADPA